MKLKELTTVYENKKVLVTGNTGFKGSWLTAILLQMKSNVVGYALEPPTSPSLYDQIALGESITQYTADVRSLENLKECLSKEKPDIIFHLAAQALVRPSYESPAETFDINVMGTVNVLEAVRQLKLQTAIVLITSDKSYDNKEWLHGYRENDALGGHDPYSASKGAGEIVISSYRDSFFNPIDYEMHGVKIASARAGNVIGGGDWAEDRIIPDCVKALQSNKPIRVRNPHATRPWQHVLEPLGGYLLLGANILKASSFEDLALYCDAFNFGPTIHSNRSVQVLVNEFLHHWGGGTWENISDINEKKRESSLLNLTIDKAYHILEWLPFWGFETTIEETVKWYKARLQAPENLRELTFEQINKYFLVK